METEAAGFRVLQGILEMIIPAAIECGKGSVSKGARTVLNILPKELTEAISGTDDDYQRILLALDHVSGMTDSSALKFFRLIRGISLPGNR
jgi:dGTPase